MDRNKFKNLKLFKQIYRLKSELKSEKFIL